LTPEQSLPAFTQAARNFLSNISAVLVDKSLQAGDMIHVVDHLFSKSESLRTQLITTKNKYSINLPIFYEVFYSSDILIRYALSRYFFDFTYSNLLDDT
jgi:hypothetical protein